MAQGSVILHRVGAAMAGAVLVGAAIFGWLGYQRYREKSVVTVADDGSSAVTQLVTAHLGGTSSLIVARLAGTVQSTASDIRGFGWLRADQVVKMPYSVDYTVDASRIGPSNVEWNDKTRTLIVDAPDVRVMPPNVDEGRRSLVRTTGIFVTREAAEQLSLRTSVNAAAKAQGEANSPQRIAQAREFARAALVMLLGAPLRALGKGDARVIVTFPLERRHPNGRQWDVSRSIEEVYNDTAT